MSTPKKAVALLSSGLDSSVACLLSHTYDCDVVQAITFDYGQRAAQREIAQAAKIAAHLGIPHRALSLPWFRSFGKGGGLLAVDSQLPHPTEADLSNLAFSEDSAKAVWVPNRNGVFIEIAAGIAEDAGAQHVIVGFNQEEAATFPDNSSEYLIAVSYALSYSTATGVTVLSPTARMDKAAIVREARQHQFPFELLWSCYEAGASMCGRCESCMRLKRALHVNRVTHDHLFANPHLH